MMDKLKPTQRVAVKEILQYDMYHNLRDMKTVPILGVSAKTGENVEQVR